MRYFFSLFIFLFTISFSFSQENEIDSLNLLLKNAKHDTTKLRLLVDLSEKCELTDILKYAQSAAELADVILNETENLSVQQKVKKLKAQAINNIGYNYNIQGDSHKALEYYQKGLRIQEETNDKTGAALSLNNMASIYNSQGEISKSLEYHLKSLKISEDINDKKGISISLNNIGNNYRNQGDTPKALEYYKKSLKIREEIKDKQGIALLMNNIGTIYISQGDNKKALECFLKSLKINEEANDKQGIAYTLKNIGHNYNNQGDFSKALEYYQKSLDISEKIKDVEGVVISLNSIGSMYLKQKKHSLALDYANRSMSMAKELGFPVRLRNAAELLYKIYRQQNKWQDALAMHELFVQMRDSIFNQETQKSTFKQQAKYEYEKQQAISEAEHQKELAIAAEEKKRQQIITYSIGFGLLMVVLFSIFIFTRLRITHRQKQIIEQQKKIVDQKNKHITDSINYAKRIQDSILPSKEELSNCFSGYFIFFQPREIVSGDFYWLSNQNGKTILAVADCTGHGVPGAFMSMIGNTLLNEIVNEKRIFQPAEILNHLNEGIVHALHQESRSQDDGMDISVCLFDNEKNKITFAGANHSMYVVQNNSIEEIKGDIFSIGSMFGKKNFSFTQQEIALLKNSSVYFSTDGFADQVGGKSGKKFLVKQMQELLVNISSLNIKEQEEKIKNAFEEWKGNYSQLDDVLVAGIKI
ncbi:MAG: tetratricopeptide repeat protein [Bacteroidetes bacterium]|nr:tetratricopeptide repeat protein [Bacteroidota bacterium]